MAQGKCRHRLALGHWNAGDGLGGDNYQPEILECCGRYESRPLEGRAGTRVSRCEPEADQRGTAGQARQLAPPTQPLTRTFLFKCWRWAKVLPRRKSRSAAVSCRTEMCYPFG